jgi:predicted protein tyrosine phosphatase
MKTINRTPTGFNWDNFDLNTLKPYLKNDLFEGIVGKQEYLTLYNADVIEKVGTVLIAIDDPGKADHPDFKVEGFDDVIQIKFHDVEEPIGNYEPLTDEQGKELKEFITKNKDKRFMIHCAAGMSRSAGCACAVECIVNYDSDVYTYKTSSSDVTAFERYHPNWTVFDKIVKDLN